ncbi:LacI family DNA-binding transcriptional regulator [Brachybacterium hainanense]|uniref:LacI family DNA-binding transcriptional regulator n=1 Tax=Brachybacterium hainanense TaxID=1541174 RepID=A0ABV6R7F8_9MICO
MITDGSTPSTGATIYEVAARAGVSIATVSRTFAGRAGVAPRTRDAVMTAAQELRYVPAAAARALAVRRSRALGVVLPHIAGPYYAQLLVGFEIAASDLGLSVVLALVSPSDHRADAVRELLGRVDGIAFMARSGADDDAVARVAAVRPTVTVARGRSAGADAFYAENRGAARELTRHLIDHGRRRIGFVGLAEDGSDIGTRHRGYLAALEEAGLAPARHLRADPVEEAGHAVADQLLEGRGVTELDALVCGNDELAIAIIARLTAAGVRVPEDLAVTGWDDTLTARYLAPSLTTVRSDVDALGGLAARRLAGRIDGEPVQEPVTVDSTLVLRGSCGCPAPALRPPAAPPHLARLSLTTIESEESS